MRVVYDWIKMLIDIIKYNKELRWVDFIKEKLYWVWDVYMCLVMFEIINKFFLNF